MNKIMNILSKIGLTDGETKVYLALLEEGTTTVGPIIDTSQVSSSKVYIILEKLIHKGLATYTIKEKTKYFQARQPIALLDIVETKEKEIQQTKEELQSALKEIEELQNQAPQEEAIIYKGYKGLKTGFYEAINHIPDGGTYYFFSTGYVDDPYVNRFFKNLARELQSRKISIKGIASTQEKNAFDDLKQFGYVMKFKDRYWPSDITIAGDYVIMFVWNQKEPTIYSLHSKTLAKSYLTYFKEQWEK